MAEHIDILLVEDSPDDQELTRIALRDSRILNALHIVEDGADALAFLRKQEPYADAPDVQLVLLDLNLPRVDGLEVLKRVKSDPALKSLPIIVLTTTDDPEYVQRAYDDYANSYITKPVDFDQFVEAIRMLDHFWLSVVRLPARR